MASSGKRIGVRAELHIIVFFSVGKHVHGAGLDVFGGKDKTKLACFGVVWFVDDLAHAGAVGRVENQQKSRRFLVSF